MPPYQYPRPDIMDTYCLCNKYSVVIKINFLEIFKPCLETEIVNYNKTDGLIHGVLGGHILANWGYYRGSVEANVFIDFVWDKKGKQYQGSSFMAYLLIRNN